MGEREGPTPDLKESHEQILSVKQKLVSREGYFWMPLKSHSYVCCCSCYISECFNIQIISVIYYVLVQAFPDMNCSASRWHCRSFTKILLLRHPHIRNTNEICCCYVQNNIILSSDRQYDHSYRTTITVLPGFRPHSRDKRDNVS